MTQIASTLAQQIARFVHTERLAPGEALTERSLAEKFLVSRSPIRTALRELQRAGVLTTAERGGFAVADPRAAETFTDAEPAPDGSEEVYLAIARDRLAAEIPDRISENELLRRYGITRARLQALLRRMSEEGWAERLPGHGWRFLPVLTSMETYRQSYSFRQAIEPAALLEKGFALDRPVLERHLEQQRRLVAGEILDISAVRLFEINSEMHEAIIECSRNAFFIESLRRVDRLRRLIEYQQQVDRELARARCIEHVRILELVLEGRNWEAADKMREHLRSLGPLKAPPSTP
ncbi:DNA-binding GntR family transcriptional regulator [Rhizobium petrolearium]|uniref:GntR family transcriptional regulator n=1 Tax=Neorhizobium petrolearium TaxID=515361 RepID=UPI001AE1D63E|nr:GntR family transcriptional regulator [Neorhizobium petrolearium]MBP1847628.1 DNA-binding GntR family transcriptional regulator [Neorhizobium petrolearium]